MTIVRLVHKNRERPPVTAWSPLSHAVMGGPVPHMVVKNGGSKEKKKCVNPAILHGGVTSVSIPFSNGDGLLVL